MNLSEYQKLPEIKRWELDSGVLIDLLDQAIDRIEKLEKRVNPTGYHDVDEFYKE